MSQKKNTPNLPNQTSEEKMEMKDTESFDQKSAAKKAVVLGTEKKKRPPMFAMVAIGVLVVAVAAYLFMTNRQKSGAVIDGKYSASSTVNQVVYPVGHFDDGKARHYEYKTAELTIKYFIIKSSDGIIRAAFDACDVCWRAGKGYLQQGDDMVCRNCGRKFASVLVNEVKGGCNPAPLTRTVEGDQLIIKVKDILEGKQFFNFSGKV
jgi:uncharacterized membrane protein